MGSKDFSKELSALGKVLEALSDLDPQQSEFVLDTVCARLGITKPLLGRSQGNRDEATDFAANENAGSGRAPSPKEFLIQKRPANGVEQIACLAYYLSKYRNVASFKTIDLTMLNSEAGGQRITNASVFTRNAVTQNGYLSPTGDGKRKITIRGEALVEALPDRDKVKKALEEQRFKGKKKKRVSKKDPD